MMRSLSLEPGPEKRNAIFRKDHAQTTTWSAILIQPRPLAPARSVRPGDAAGTTVPIRLLLLAAGSRNLGGEIGFLLFDSLAESIAHKSGDLHRRADLAFGFLQRLGDRFALFVVDEGLLQQADFLVIGLQAGLDDLFDHVLGLALLTIFVSQHVLFATHQFGIEAGR